MSAGPDLAARVRGGDSGGTYFISYWHPITGGDGWYPVGSLPWNTWANPSPTVPMLASRSTYSSARVRPIGMRTFRIQPTTRPRVASGEDFGRAPPRRDVAPFQARGLEVSVA